MHRLYRILASLGLLFGSTVLVFALLEAAPGGPMAAYLQNPSVGASDVAALNRELGLSQPVFVRYFAWLFRVLRGDLGWSPSNSEPVSQAIVERLPATIELAIFGFLGILVVGAVIGFVRARARASKLRDVLAVPPLLFRAIPVVLLTLYLQLLPVFWSTLPGAGIASGEAFDLRDRLAHLSVPVLCLAVPFGAWASLIFCDFFRASGTTMRTSVRNIIGTVALTAALIGPASMAAGLIVEPMFAWPGVGRLFYNGLSLPDPGVVAGLLLLYSAGVVLLKLCAELAPGLSDRTLPRQSGSPQRFVTPSRRLSAIGNVGFVVLIAAVLGAVTASLIAPVGPYFIDQAHFEGYPLAPGVAGHALGTDDNGRDLLSRLLIGLRTSLGIAALAALIATVIGAVVAKAVSAVTWFDDRGARSVIAIRPFAAYPFILFMVAVLAANYTAKILSPLVITVIIAAVSWPAVVPAFRALTPASLRGGVVNLFACALLLEVTLSKIGYGIQPPTPSLGNMFANAQSLLFMAPWIPVIPTIIIVVLLFALYAVADDLRDIDGRVG